MIQTQLCPVPTLKRLTRKPPIFFHFFFLPGTISAGFVGYKQWYLPSRKSTAAQPFFPTWHWDTEYLTLATPFLKPWRPPWVLWHRIKLILWTLTSSATAQSISPLPLLWWEQLAQASPRQWQTCWASSTSPRYMYLLRWGSSVSRDQDSKGCRAHCPYSLLFSYLWLYVSIEDLPISRGTVPWPFGISETPTSTMSTKPSRLFQNSFKHTMYKTLSFLSKCSVIYFSSPSFRKCHFSAFTKRNETMWCKSHLSNSKYLSLILFP